MFILISSIIILLISRKFFPTYKDTINKIVIVLSVWLTLGTILKHFLADEPSRKYTDVEMAQNLIKEDPEFKKAKMKILDDGSVKISVKKKKWFLLKDGVLTSLR